jgi:hypothetical protein
MKKIIVLLFLVLLNLFIFSNDTKHWKTILTFNGNGEKKSALFELNGNPAKIVYKYNSNFSAGLLAICVVDIGKDIMKDGDFPDILIDSINEESESFVYKSAGEYYLYVYAAGTWQIEIQEEE